MSTKLSEENYIVYRHTDPDGLVYIGATKMTTGDRWKSDGMGYFHQKIFFHAILQKGWNNFKHEILYSGLSGEEAFAIERELILKSESYDRRRGYNTKVNGFYNRSEYNNDKMSNSRRKPIREKPAFVHSGKAVLKKTYNEETIETYKSVAEASRSLGIPSETLRTLLNKNKRLDFDDFYLMYSPLGKLPRVEMYSLDDELLRTFGSVAEAYRYIGRVNKGQITRVCMGRSPSYMRFIWRFNYED